MEAILDRGRTATGAIGSIRLLSLGQPHRIVAGRLSLPSRKLLALAVALVLVAGVFVFFGGEAQAQELPQPQHTVTTDGVAVEQTILATPVEASPVRKSPAETAQVEPPSTSEHTSLVLGPAPGFPVEPASQSQLVSVTVDGYDPETPAGAEPAMPVVPALKPVEPELPVPESVPEPAAFEKSEPLSSLFEEAPGPAIPDLGEESYPPASLEDPTSGVVETADSAASKVSESFAGGPLLQPAAEGEVSPDTFLAPFSKGAADHVPVGGRTGDAETSSAGSAGTGNSSEGTPQLPSPLAPPFGGSSFSLSGNGGQAGPGGSLAPLLVCVLASGLILLRRDGPLRRWVSFEPPKPSSALLAPLERPG